MESRLDAANASLLKSKLLSYIGPEQPTIILDLSEVQSMDSSALWAIIGALKSVAADKQLVLCGVQQAVERLFTITRMNKVFTVFPTSDEAVKTLQK
jgi:anti-sigma B factor antagonist